VLSPSRQLACIGTCWCCCGCSGKL
jgi:hypothetical protein